MYIMIATWSCGKTMSVTLDLEVEVIEVSHMVLLWRELANIEE